MTEVLTQPAGWYSDQRLPWTDRYWDGVSWTDLTRPAVIPRHWSAPRGVHTAWQPLRWVLLLACVVDMTEAVVANRLPAELLGFSTALLFAFTVFWWGTRRPTRLLLVLPVYAFGAATRTGGAFGVLAMFGLAGAVLGLGTLGRRLRPGVGQMVGFVIATLALVLVYGLDIV